MMNALGSECSSGCESGWTLYLEPNSHTSSCWHFIGQDKEEEEEEDLSMISDASSGPPHLPPGPDAQRQKVKENQQPFLDDTDTATSPVLNTNQQTSTDYSQGFSATYYEERSSLQDHFGFLQRTETQSENGVHNNK